MNQQTFSFVSQPEIPIAVQREQGEAGKRQGMTLSAERRPELIATGQVALLRALLVSPKGTGTVDDATDDLSLKFERGGKWRGSVPSRLAMRGIIERVGDMKSARPSRHRGYVSVWRLRDAERAQAEVERLLAWLDTLRETRSRRQPTAGIEFEGTKPDSRGNASDDADGAQKSQNPQGLKGFWQSG